MNLILSFMYVFDFILIKKLPHFSSLYVVLLFLLSYFFLNSRYRKCFFKYIASKESITTFGWIFSLIILSLANIVIKYTFDYSYSITLIHQMLCLITGMMLISYFKMKKVDIINLLIDTFFVQSLIQIVCFFSPAFLKLTDAFRADYTIYKRIESYDGFRGLAVSGVSFFGLAVIYAVLFVVLAFYWPVWNKKKHIKIIYFLCFCFGAFSAGRTSVIGIIVFLIVVFYRWLNKYIKELFFCDIGFFSVKRKMCINKDTLRKSTNFVFVIFLIVFVSNTTLFEKVSKNKATERFLNYLLQFKNNKNSGSDNIENIVENVPSLKHLINDMYFTLSPKQLLFGDGKYVVDGLYYMHTDAGIMRNLLFWGVIGTALLYLYFAYSLFANAKCKKARMISLWILFICAVFEVKGQTMGFLICLQCMTLMITHGFECFQKYNNRGDIILYD